MIKFIIAVVFFALLGFAKKLTYNMPEGKEHIPLQIFWTFIFGIGITFALWDFDKKTNFGYSIVNDSTKPHNHTNWQGDSVYHEYLVYEKTGEIVSGDCSFYDITLKKYGDYVLAECKQDRDKEGMVVKIAILFQLSVFSCQFSVFCLTLRR